MRLFCIVRSKITCDLRMCGFSQPTERSWYYRVCNRVVDGFGEKRSTFLNIVVRVQRTKKGRVVVEETCSYRDVG